MSEAVDIGGLRLLLRERGNPLLDPTAEDRSSRINGMDVSVPSAVFLPTGGMGFFGWPAISGHRDGQNFTIEFSDWTSARKGKTVTLSGRDAVAALAINITIEESGEGVLSFRTRIVNQGTDDYTLDRCMAGSVLIDGDAVEVTSFGGMWGREFHQTTERLGRGLWLQESRRGRTSHDKSPGVKITADGKATLVHLGWSGNHQITIDRLDDGRRLLHAGELFEPGEMRLKPGEAYESLLLYVSREADSFPRFVRDRLIAWPGGRMKPRSVTLNTWEGNYFAHDLASLKEQADAAADLGIERFVLDDGWFGKRDDDTSSLGDWTVDPRKYPQGLKPLVDHVRSRGMEFGLWLEPEMINPNSDLYRQHPDWALQVRGRPHLLSRNQLVLDLTRKEVTDHLFTVIDKLLSSLDIAYIKWDMNRDLTHAGEAEGRAATARQTRALYALWQRIRAAHTNVEIESCASGGGRADYGALRYTHRIWTSDCTDALERLEIQRGASTFFPPAILGAHVSASPNHQTHRRHTLSFRAIVALAYHFGVELNPLALTTKESAELRNWISLHKRLRPILHEGNTFRQEPIDGRYVWGASENDKLVAFVAQGPQMMSEQPRPLRLPLPSESNTQWRITALHPEKPDFIRISEAQAALLSGKRSFAADEPLQLPMLRPESALILELERIEGA